MSPDLEMSFDEASHTYRVGGSVWPSVSAILEPLNQLDGIPPEILRRAAEFGTNVHLACHLINTGRLDRASLDDALAPYVAAWDRCLFESGAVVVASEVRVLHPTLKYAGTMDTAIRLTRRTRSAVHALDIKTSATVPRTCALQTAAYREAYVRVRPDLSKTRYCCHLRGDGTYRLIPYESPGDWNTFVSALNVYRWRAKA